MSDTMPFLPKKPDNIAAPSQVLDFDADDFMAFEEGTAQAKKLAPNDGIERHPRQTLIKMLEAVPDFDTEFTFKTIHGTGFKYVHRMRVEMSRARSGNEDLKKGRNHFHLFVVSVDQKDTHDDVTVVRSQRASLKQLKATDELARLMRGLQDKLGA